MNRLLSNRPIILMIYRSDLQLISILLLALSCNSLWAQNFYYATSRYDDRLTEWMIYDTLDQEMATLEYAGLPSDAFRSWNFRLQDRPGSVKLRWRENPNEWDLRRDQHLLSIKPVWPGQLEEWLISDGNNFFHLKLRKEYEGLRWELVNTSNDLLAYVINDYSYDPRDWSFYYETDLNNDDLCMAAFFIIVQYTPVMLNRY